MIKTEVLSVRDPQWANEDGSQINCWIRTNTLIGEHPFTACKYDTEPHGREVYARCLAGEFGEISPLHPIPTPTTNAASPCPVPPAFGQLQSFLSEVNQENARASYRAVAITWASFLDRLLDEMLEAEASSAIAAGRAVDKPPRKFSQRIDRALQIGLLDEGEAKKCHHIRHVRNALAHEWEPQAAIKDALPNLRALFDLDHAGLFVFHEDLDFLVRLIYSGSCGTLAVNFTTRLHQSSGGAP
jgi:hypothetical protein